MNAQRLLQHFHRIAEAPDAVPRLRRFILDLAVRGKLVEQDPNDEPASEQLKRIRVTKAKRNLKEKAKLGKQKYPADAEHKTYQLPDGWVWASLADLTAVLNGRAYSKNELLDEGTPVLRVGNLFTSDHWYYSNLTLEDDKYCDEGDLLFSWSASFGPFIWPGPRVIYHYHIWKLSLHDEPNLDRNYFYRFLLHKTQEIKDAGHGVSMIHMTKEKMEWVQVPVPPLAEQHRIVAKVDELMALCDRLAAAQNQREQRRDRLVTASLRQLQDEECLTRRHEGAKEENEVNEKNLGAFAPSREPVFLQDIPRLTTRPEHIKPLRQTILNLAILGRLVAQDPNDEPAAELLKEIRETRQRLYAEKRIPKPKSLPTIEELALPFLPPSGWAWCMLGELCYQVSDGPHFSPQYVLPENGVPFLSTRNVRPDGFDLSTVKYVSLADHEEFCKRIRPERDDIIYTKGGTTGIAKVNDLDFDFSVWVHLAVLRIEKKRLLPRYVEMALNSPLCYEQSQRYTQGTSNFDLGLTRMIKIKVPLPPLPEQHRIVAKVDELMALCDRLEAQLAATQADSRRLLEAVLREALA